MRFRMLVASILLYSCMPGQNTDTSQAQNHELQKKIDSLQAVIVQLQKSPDEIIKDTRALVMHKDIEPAKQQLKLIKSWQLSRQQLNTIYQLTASVNNLSEEKAFAGLSSADTSQYSVFIYNYPKSHYVPVVRKAIKKFRYPAPLVTRPVGIVQKNYKAQKRYIPATSGIRIGAICCDGTRSYATGRGACSHHGGVCQWLYE